MIGEQIVCEVVIPKRATQTRLIPAADVNRSKGWASSCRMSGLREAYFGKVFQNASHSVQEMYPESHIVRFVESFQLNGNREMWLVFYDEGASLSQVGMTADSQVNSACITHDTF